MAPVKNQGIDQRKIETFNAEFEGCELDENKLPLTFAEFMRYSNARQNIVKEIRRLNSNLLTERVINELGRLWYIQYYNKPESRRNGPFQKLQPIRGCSTEIRRKLKEMPVHLVGSSSNDDEEAGIDDDMPSTSAKSRARLEELNTRYTRRYAKHIMPGRKALTDNSNMQKLRMLCDPDSDSEQSQDANANWSKKQERTPKKRHITADDDDNVDETSDGESSVRAKKSKPMEKSKGKAITNYFHAVPKCKKNEHAVRVEEMIGDHAHKEQRIESPKRQTSQSEETGRAESAHVKGSNVENMMPPEAKITELLGNYIADFDAKNCNFPVTFKQFKQNSYYHETIEAILRDMACGSEAEYQKLRQDTDIRNMVIEKFYGAYYLNPVVRTRYKLRLKMCPKHFKDLLVMTLDDYQEAKTQSPIRFTTECSVVQPAERNAYQSSANPEEINNRSMHRTSPSPTLHRTASPAHQNYTIQNLIDILTNSQPTYAPALSPPPSSSDMVLASDANGAPAQCSAQVEQVSMQNGKISPSEAPLLASNTMGNKKVSSTDGALVSHADDVTIVVSNSIGARPMAPAPSKQHVDVPATSCSSEEKCTAPRAAESTTLISAERAFSDDFLLGYIAAHCKSANVGLHSRILKRVRTEILGEPPERQKVNILSVEVLDPLQISPHLGASNDDEPRSNAEREPVSLPPLERVKLELAKHTNRYNTLAYLIVSNMPINRGILLYVKRMSIEEWQRYVRWYNEPNIFEDMAVVRYCHGEILRNDKVWPPFLYFTLHDLMAYLASKGLPYSAATLKHIPPALLHWSDLIEVTDFDECVHFHYYRETRQRIDSADLLLLRRQLYYEECWRRDEWVKRVPMITSKSLRQWMQDVHLKIQQQEEAKQQALQTHSPTPLQPAQCSALNTSLDQHPGDSDEPAAVASAPSTVQMSPEATHTQSSKQADQSLPPNSDEGCRCSSPSAAPVLGVGTQSRMTQTPPPLASDNRCENAPLTIQIQISAPCHATSSGEQPTEESFDKRQKSFHRCQSARAETRRNATLTKPSRRKSLRFDSDEVGSHEEKSNQCARSLGSEQSVENDLAVPLPPTTPEPSSELAAEEEQQQEQEVIAKFSRIQLAAEQTQATARQSEMQLFSDQNSPPQLSQNLPEMPCTSTQHMASQADEVPLNSPNLFSSCGSTTLSTQSPAMPANTIAETPATPMKSAILLNAIDPQLLAGVPMTSMVLIPTSALLDYMKKSPGGGMHTLPVHFCHSNAAAGSDATQSASVSPGSSVRPELDNFVNIQNTQAQIDSLPEELQVACDPLDDRSSHCEGGSIESPVKGSRVRVKRESFEPLDKLQFNLVDEDDSQEFICVPISDKPIDVCDEHSNLSLDMMEMPETQGAVAEANLSLLQVSTSDSSTREIMEGQNAMHSHSRLPLIEETSSSEEEQTDAPISVEQKREIIDRAQIPKIPIVGARIKHFPDKLVPQKTHKFPALPRPVATEKMLSTEPQKTSGSSLSNSQALGTDMTLFNSTALQQAVQQQQEMTENLGSSIPVCEEQPQAIEQPTIPPAAQSHPEQVTTHSKTSENVIYCKLLQFHYFKALRVQHIKKYTLPTLNVGLSYTHAVVGLNDGKCELYGSSILECLLHKCSRQLRNDLQTVLAHLGEYNFHLFEWRRRNCNAHDTYDAPAANVCVRVLNHFFGSFSGFCRCRMHFDTPTREIGHCEPLQENEQDNEQLGEPLSALIKPHILSEMKILREQMEARK